MEIVATPVTIGPFFLGDQVPDIKAYLTYDSGGYVDLTDGSAVFAVQRWNARKGEPYGLAVTGGACSLGVPARGEVVYSWDTAPLPLTPGWYCGRFTVTFSSGKIQTAQPLLFELRAGAPLYVAPDEDGDGSP